MGNRKPGIKMKTRSHGQCFSRSVALEHCWHICFREAHGRVLLARVLTATILTVRSAAFKFAAANFQVQKMENKALHSVINAGWSWPPTGYDSLSSPAAHRRQLVGGKARSPNHTDRACLRLSIASRSSTSGQRNIPSIV